MKNKSIISTQNPFITSGYVSPDYFCDREQETAEIIRKLTNGNNLVLISPRRMGKTGLIHHCFAQNELQNDYYTFFIDIYATGSLKEFVFKLGKEIFETLKPKGKKFLDQFFAVITSLRPAFKLDSYSGTPVFDIGIGEIVKPEVTLDEIFKYLETAGKPCIVAIDEFQQIAKYPEKNVEAILRTHIQQCKNTFFIFAGSQRHTMQNIFFSSSRPFYQSVSLLSLNAIEEAKYTEFVIRHFETGKRHILPETITLVYRFFEGHTWYMQHIFNEIYSLLDRGKTFDPEMLTMAIKTKIDSFIPLFLSTLSLLTERQKEVLIAIGKEGKAEKIASGDFAKKHGLLSVSSTQTAVKQLLEKELITSENNVYQVYDRFWGLWLSEVYGIGYLNKIR